MHKLFPIFSGIALASLIGSLSFPGSTLAQPADHRAAAVAATQGAGEAVPPVAPPGRPRVSVERFAVAPRRDPATISEMSCPSEPNAAPIVDQKVQNALVQDIYTELQKKLSSRAEALPEMGSDSLPIGAIVIAGCITQVQGGNAAARLVGLGLGASHLAAHVQLLTRTNSGLHSVREFDIAATGKNTLPPLGAVGLVVHGLKASHQTLAADSDRLADGIAACALEAKCPSAQDTEAR